LAGEVARKVKLRFIRLYVHISLGVNFRAVVIRMLLSFRYREGIFLMGISSLAFKKQKEKVILCLLLFKGFKPNMPEWHTLG
jgi:hypothetical protein